MKFILLLFSLLILTLSQAQIITTVAGNGTYGYSGDGGPATAAKLGNPVGVISDNVGNIYITDFANNVIRKVNSFGVIENFAGTGTLGYSGDGGTAVAAHLYHPSAITRDNAGNIYFADQNGEVIRKVSTSGIITSITGNLPPGYAGDGGYLMLAQFRDISNITFDNAGNMFITDFGNNVIRKVNSSGIINTIAGTGTAGFSGDGGPATAAKLDAPYGVLILATGDILICDARNNRLRVVNSAGIISTYAGTGAAGYTGDGGPAISATFHWPSYTTIDNLGNIYITDALNLVVRKIDNTGMITTYAGNGTQGYSGDGGPAILAQMVDVCGIAYDDLGGNLYIVNRNLADVIRKVTTCPPATFTKQPGNGILCGSGNTIFTVTASNASSYQWQLNTGTGWTNISNNSIYSGTNTNTLAITGAITGMNNYKYRCSITNNCGTVFSTTALLLIILPATPSISIKASSNTICKGEPVTFTASITNGGIIPSYQWKKNGINVGSNTNTYDDNTIATGDVINCVLTSNSNCITTPTATSNPITIIVNTPLTPEISIAPSLNNICFGTQVTFNATTLNEGSNPIYQWKKNGVNIGSNLPTYTDNSLNNGDIISCILTSNQNCISTSTINSNKVIMSVNPLETPSIAIRTTNPSICVGKSATFFATLNNGGPLPVYKWRKNGINVGTNSSSYTSNNFVNGDIISCLLTSNGNCLTTNTVTSNSITLNVFQNPNVQLEKTNTLCIGGSRTLDAGDFASYLWNNGNNGKTLNIDSIGTYYVTVTDINGCVGSDTTKVITLLQQPDNFLPPDTSICSYGSVTISATSGFVNYLWSNHSNQSSLTITKAGLYWLEVKDKNSCIGKDTILVSSKQCLMGFYIPTAFSPNNDGKNDYFKPFLFGNLIKYKFMIYNQWGQAVFQTTDLNKGWDGSFKGTKQGVNVFVWVCNYQFENEHEENQKGTVVLIR